MQEFAVTGQQLGLALAFFFGFVLIGLPALLGSLVLRAERN